MGTFIAHFNVTAAGVTAAAPNATAPTSGGSSPASGPSRGKRAPAGQYAMPANAADSAESAVAAIDWLYSQFALRSSEDWFASALHSPRRHHLGSQPYQLAAVSPALFDRFFAEFANPLFFD